jgi:hypothetical protein
MQNKGASFQAIINLQKLDAYKNANLPHFHEMLAELDEANAFLSKYIHKFSKRNILLLQQAF